MTMLSKRIQYLAYIFFVIGFGLYLYSYFGNKWYKVDYSDELENSFVEVKEYTEGLISVCWFGDCANIGVLLPHKSLKTIYVARILMITAIWILSLCLVVSVYKIHFTPDWWKSKIMLSILGGAEVVAGFLMCLATFFYLFYHDLSVEGGGAFQDGCYTAWLAGAMFITFGLFSSVAVNSIMLPVSHTPASNYERHSSVNQDKSPLPNSLKQQREETLSPSPSFPRFSRILSLPNSLKTQREETLSPSPSFPRFRRIL